MKSVLVYVCIYIYICRTVESTEKNDSGVTIEVILGGVVKCVYIILICKSVYVFVLYARIFMEFLSNVSTNSIKQV